MRNRQPILVRRLNNKPFGVSQLRRKPWLMYFISIAAKYDLVENSQHSGLILGKRSNP